MKKKDYAKMLGAIALTAAIAVTGTFAYLNKITETKTNTFTSSKNISTELTETEFKKDSGKDYVPGQVIAKNPVMKNDANKTDGLPIYVGVKLEYIDNDGNHLTREEFTEKYAKIFNNDTEGFSDKWVLKGSYNDGKDGAKASDFYVYNKVLEPGEPSDAIFTKIEVQAGIVEVFNTDYTKETVYQITIDEDGKEIKKPLTEIETVDTKKDFYLKNGAGEYVKVNDAYKLPTFEIKVTGYAVQGNKDVSTDEAITELVNLAEAQAISR